MGGKCSEILQTTGDRFLDRGETLKEIGMIFPWSALLRQFSREIKVAQPVLAGSGWQEFEPASGSIKLRLLLTQRATNRFR